MKTESFYNQYLFICSLAQHGMQQHLCLVTGAGSFGPALFKDFLKDRYGNQPGGQKQNPEPSGEQTLAALAAGCSKGHQGLLTTRALAGLLGWPSPAGFGPCSSAKGSPSDPSPPSPAGAMGAFWTEGVFSSENGIYLVAQEPTCRDNQAQQNTCLLRRLHNQQKE